MYFYCTLCNLFPSSKRCTTVSHNFSLYIRRVFRFFLEKSVVDWMEKYRIGNLSAEDTIKARNFQHGDMYETDPPRDPNLLPCTKVKL